jgi:hypothetical protein
MKLSDKMSAVVGLGMKNGHGLLILALLFSGCLAKKIPGTDIEDTSDTRAVLDVIQDFRKAVENRDAKAVKALANEDFRDDGGSANPDDDFEFKTLEIMLGERFNKVNELKLDLTVRRIEFTDDAASARVTYSYTMSFKMPDYSSRTQTETDIKQMTLKRASEKNWKISSGI